MFERFTDRARRVVALAQEEARMLNHNYIGTEHILLGLIRESEGVAAKALESLGISLEAVRQQVKEIIGRGQQAPSGHIPFTPRAKKVLELSLREADGLGHNYIGTEHLLLGLIRAGWPRSNAGWACGPTWTTWTRRSHGCAGRRKPRSTGRISMPLSRCATRRRDCWPPVLARRGSGPRPLLAACRWPGNWTG